MSTASLKPVLLSREQVSALREIQEQERRKSSLKIAPSIHIIARQLMENALEDIKKNSQSEARPYDL